MNPYAAPNQRTTKTIAAAIELANFGDKIRITPGLYTEQIVVRKPGLTFEPSIVGGDVILQQEVDPCIVVEIDNDDTAVFQNIKMLMVGPNMDVEV